MDGFIFSRDVKIVKKDSIVEFQNEVETIVRNSLILIDEKHKYKLPLLNLQAAQIFPY